MKARVAVEKRAIFGEGPFWDETKNVLYWVDILGKSVHSYNPKNNEDTAIRTDMIPSFVYQKDGEVFVALDGSIYNLKDEEFKFIAQPDDYNPKTRFNDGALDKNGRLWIGTMALDQSKDESIGMGALYKYENYAFEKVISDVTISNGIAFDYDIGKMYFIDSHKLNVVSFDYDLELGRISNEKEIVTFDKSEGQPDGMTIDEKGNLYIALYGGFGVCVYSPKLGRKIGFIDVDAYGVTSVEFGGENKETLYITTVQSDNNDLGGALFEIDKREIVF